MDVTVMIENTFELRATKEERTIAVVEEWHEPVNAVLYATVQSWQSVKLIFIHKPLRISLGKDKRILNLLHFC